MSSSKEFKTHWIIDNSKPWWIFGFTVEICWYESWLIHLPPGHLLLDSVPNTGPLISCWELDKFRNCWTKTFRTSKNLTLLYQQFPNLLISQRDMSGPRLRALSNNRWSRGTEKKVEPALANHYFNNFCLRIHTPRLGLRVSKSSGIKRRFFYL